MPGKSSQRHLSRRQRKKEKHGSPVIASPRQEVFQKDKPVAHPRAVAPAVAAPAPKVTPPVVRYPYIAAELRRIGVLGGIILAILVVLALVFS